MKKIIKLLIVEDDEANSILLSEYFAQMGISAFMVDNGISAIEFVKSNLDTDLILMDLRLPQMNGIDATKHIKELLPECIVIAQTSYVNSETRTKTLEAGVDAFFSKPLDLNKLLEYLLQHFSI